MDTEAKTRTTSPLKKTARKSFIGPFNPGFLDNLPHTVLLHGSRKQPAKSVTTVDKRGVNVKDDKHKNQELYKRKHMEPSKELKKRQCGTENIINNDTVFKHPTTDTGLKSTTSAHQVSEGKHNLFKSVGKENKLKTTKNAFSNSIAVNPFKRLRVGAKIPRANLERKVIVDKLVDEELKKQGFPIEDNRKAVDVLSKTNRLSEKEINSQKRKPPPKVICNKETSCPISKAAKVSFSEKSGRQDLKPKVTVKPTKATVKNSSTLDKVSSTSTKVKESVADTKTLSYGKDKKQSERQKDGHKNHTSNDTSKRDSLHKSKVMHTARIDAGKRKRLESDTLDCNAFKRKESNVLIPNREVTKKKPSVTIENDQGVGIIGTTSKSASNVENTYQTDKQTFTDKSDQIKSFKVDKSSSRKEKDIQSTPSEHSTDCSETQKYFNLKDTFTSPSFRKEKKNHTGKSDKHMSSVSSKGRDRGQIYDRSSGGLKKKRRHKSDSTSNLEKLSVGADEGKCWHADRDQRKDHQHLSTAERMNEQEGKEMDGVSESLNILKTLSSNTAFHLAQTTSQLNTSKHSSVTDEANSTLQRESVQNSKKNGSRSPSIGENANKHKNEQASKKAKRHERSKSVDALGLSISCFQNNVNGTDVKLNDKDQDQNPKKINSLGLVRVDNEFQSERCTFETAKTHLPELIAANDVSDLRQNDSESFIKGQENLKTPMKNSKFILCSKQTSMLCKLQEPMATGFSYRKDIPDKLNLFEDSFEESFPDSPYDRLIIATDDNDIDAKASEADGSDSTVPAADDKTSSNEDIETSFSERMFSDHKSTTEVPVPTEKNFIQSNTGLNLFEKLLKEGFPDEFAKQRARDSSSEISISQEGQVHVKRRKSGGAFDIDVNKQLPSLNNSNITNGPASKNNSVISAGICQPGNNLPDTTAEFQFNIKTEPGIDNGSPILRNDVPEFNIPQEISILESPGKTSTAMSLEKQDRTQSSSSNEIRIFGNDNGDQSVCPGVSTSVTRPTDRNHQLVSTCNSKSKVFRPDLFEQDNMASIMSLQFNRGKQFVDNLWNEKKMPICIPIYHQKKTSVGSVVETSGSLYPQLFYNRGNRCVCCYFCSAWISALEFMVHHDNLPLNVELNHIESLSGFQIHFRGELNKEQCVLWNQFCRDLANFKRSTNTQGSPPNQSTIDSPNKYQRTVQRSKEIESICLNGKAPKSLTQPMHRHQESKTVNCSPPIGNLYDSPIPNKRWPQQRTELYQEELNRNSNPNVWHHRVDSFQRSTAHLINDLPKNGLQALTAIGNLAAPEYRQEFPPTRKQHPWLSHSSPVNHPNSVCSLSVANNPHHSVSSQECDLPKCVSDKSVTQDAYHGLSALSAHVPGQPTVQDQNYVSSQTAVQNPPRNLSSQTTVQNPHRNLSCQTTVQNPHHNLSSQTTVQNPHQNVSSQTTVQNPHRNLSSQTTVQNPHHNLSSQTAVQTPHQNVSSQTTVQNPHCNLSSQTAVQNPHHSVSSQTAVQNPHHNLSSQTAVQNPHHYLSSQTTVQNPHNNLSGQTAVQTPHHNLSSQTAVQNPHHNLSSQTAVQTPHHNLSSQTAVQNTHHNLSSQTAVQNPHNLSSQTAVQNPHHNLSSQTTVQNPHNLSSQTEVQTPHHNLSSQTAVQTPHHNLSSRTAVQNPNNNLSSQTAVQTPHHNLSIQTAVQTPHHNLSSQTAVQNPHNNLSSQTAVQTPHHNLSSQTAVQNPHHNLSSQTAVQNPQRNLSSQTAVRTPHHILSSQTAVQDSLHCSSGLTSALDGQHGASSDTSINTEIVAVSNSGLSITSHHLKSMDTFDLLTLSQKCHSRVLKRLLSEKENHSEEIKMLKLQLNSELQGRRELQSTVNTLLSEVDRLKTHVSVSHLGVTNSPAPWI